MTASARNVLARDSDEIRPLFVAATFSSPTSSSRIRDCVEVSSEQTQLEESRLRVQRGHRPQILK